jgi:hypothetical protein
VYLPPLLECGFSWFVSPLVIFYLVEHITPSIRFFPSLLNRLRYVLVNLSFAWVIPKSSVELFLVGILILKCATSLAQRSLKLATELGSRLLYHVLTEPLKVVGIILHMTWLS